MRTRSFWQANGMLRRCVVVALLACVVPAMSGCYGRFPLTKSVYKFNGDVSDNEIVQSVAMWLMVIVPVYEVAWLGDALVVNLIEFYKNDDLNIGQADPAGAARVVVAEDGQSVSLVKVGDGRLEVRDAAGRVLGTAVRSAEGLRLTDAQGNTLRTLSPPQLAAL